MATNRLDQTDANAVPMAGKRKAPQSEVDEVLAGQDAEVAGKTNVHWLKRDADNGKVENISKAKSAWPFHVLTRRRMSETVDSLYDADIYDTLCIDEIGDTCYYQRYMTI
jgi:hypothetical protein